MSPDDHNTTAQGAEHDPEHKHSEAPDAEDARDHAHDVAKVKAGAQLDTSERNESEEALHKSACCRVDDIDHKRECIRANQLHFRRERRLNSGRNVIRRASVGLEKRIEHLKESEGLTEEEASRQANKEAFHDEYEKAGDDIIREMAFKITQNNLDKNSLLQTEEKLRSFFKKYTSFEDPSGIAVFRRQMIQGWSSPGARQLLTLQNELTAQFGFSEGHEVMDIIMARESSIMEMQEARLLAVAANGMNGKRLEEFMHQYTCEGEVHERCACIHDHLKDDIDDPTAKMDAQNIIRHREESDEVVAEAETQAIFEGTTIELKWGKSVKRRREKEEKENKVVAYAAKRFESITLSDSAILDSLGVDDAVLDKLPEEGKEAVVKIAKEGGKEVVKELLSGDMDVSSSKLEGSIAGTETELTFHGHSIAIVGHKTGKLYKLPGVRPQHYDLTRLYELGMEDGHNLNKSFTSAFANLVARVDVGDEELMTDSDAHKYHKYLGIFVGPGVDAKVENKRLRRLGALGGGDVPNPTRLKQLSKAIPNYIPIEGEGGIHRKGAAEYEDFVTLVDIWDTKGFALPPLSKLKRGTKKRLRKEQRLI